MINEKNLIKKKKKLDSIDNSIICKVSQNMGFFFFNLWRKKKVDNIYFFPTKFLKVSTSLVLLS